MHSIRGIYTGKEIKPLEDIHVRPNVHVIITFLDEVAEDIEEEQKAGRDEKISTKTPTQVFLEKCAGWEDTRSTEEIIAEIYASRTTSERGAHLIHEDTR